MSKISEEAGLVGIVTVTFNSGAVLPDFIQSLNAQDYRANRIWAIDNDSKDNSVVQLRSWGREHLQIIENRENLGVAEANNQGIRAALDAGCEYILLLNNDVIFGPTLISDLVKGLSDYACSMTTPLIYFADQPNRIWAAGGCFRKDYPCLNQHIGEKEIDNGQYSEPKAITYAPSCCLLIKSEVFKHIGFMDERYFVYFDDTDFMLRALRAGKITYYLPKTKLWHKVSSLTGGDESPFNQRYMERNRAFFIKKNFSSWNFIYYTILFRLHYVVRYLKGRDTLDALLRKQRAWSEGQKMIR